MDQPTSALRASYPRLMKAGIAVMIKFMVVLVVLAFFHNLFAVDIHFNHAKHEFAVQLIVNDCQHMQLAKLLNLAGHYLVPRGLAGI
jgi:hypothetical protein